MSKVNPNVKPAPKTIKTRLAGGYGAAAARQDSEALLRRATMACLLWEDLAYETGEQNTDNIATLIPKVSAEIVKEIVEDTRIIHKLRHVPLYMASEMARYPEYNKYLADLLPTVITRADQLTDFLAIYWKEGKRPLTRQVKKGLASAFNNFNEYQFAKYDREGVIKLRDVMFLCHPKPKDQAQQDIFNKITSRSLKVPDTWEVEISASKDKKASWTRLIEENKLGTMAFLRNLRNFKENNVDHNVIRKGFSNQKSTMILPMNFFNAVLHAPEFKAEIEELMLKTYQDLEKLPGRTLLMIDISGSMNAMISSKSTMCRLDAACAMAVLANHMCESIDIYATAGSIEKKNKTGDPHASLKIKYPSKGFDLVTQLKSARQEIGQWGIFTRRALEFISNAEKGIEYDRIIIISDSQDEDGSGGPVPNPFGKRNYIIDVSSHKHGIAYRGKWDAEISGFSEAFINYIATYEGLENAFQEEQ